MSEITTETQPTSQEILDEVRARMVKLHEATTVEDVREEVAAVLASATLLAMHIDRVSRRLSVVENLFLAMLTGGPAGEAPTNPLPTGETPMPYRPGTYL